MNPSARSGQETRFPTPGEKPIRTRIKLCGFTRARDIEGAARLGADAIGLVCVPGSKRELSPAQAAELRQHVPPFVATVLLLSNADEAFAREAIDKVRPDFVQYHGTETGRFCASLGRPYFKAVPVSSQKDVIEAARQFPSAAALLLDSHGADGMGGTGEAFDWSLIPRNLDMALILAGGLTPANVGRAVRMAAPYAVDVSSGIENGPGRKDFEKMKAFVEAVRLADSEMPR
ncbi:MAG: phosphoribosylanthranilate isomerase [Panacagrimonas sp.]|nr:phosphoribosylanthranilate isomerase [Panacagrimonas sp.]MCC2656186.1 phosphoribosylanthranilate isomerase [Panacagrimonas sp.]